MREEQTAINIPDVTVTECKRMLLSMYKGSIDKGVPLKKLPTPFFWGPPGVGKSDSVFQLAKELEEETGKKVCVIDIRLLLFSPVDLRGVPVADANREFTNWLKPRIFDLDASEECINIIFLDELSAAPQSVQAAAYQICLDHKIGEFTLPENTIVIAAGNRVTDQSVSYKMPKALCNRLLHINICTDYGAWRKWAVENNISEKVIAYLGYDSTKLCVEAEASDLAYPTPRSWEFVSTVLKTVSDDPAMVHQLIAGCVGEDSAIEFEIYCKGTSRIPDVELILEGDCSKRPTNHDEMYALISRLVTVIRERHTELTTDNLENICQYAAGFPADYLNLFTTDLCSIKNLKEKLMKCHSFWALLQRGGV